MTCSARYGDGLSCRAGNVSGLSERLRPRGKAVSHNETNGKKNQRARRNATYAESGRSKRWLKIKNPNSPAMRRVIEETF